MNGAEQFASNGAAYEIEFTLDRDDLLAFARHCLPRSRVLTVLMYTANVVVVTALGLVSVAAILLFHRFFSGEWYEPDYRPFAIALVIALVFVFARSPAIKRKTLDQQAEKWATHFEEQQWSGMRRLLTSREQIAVTSGKGETIRNWKAIRGVETTDSHAFIRSDVTIIVPRRAFSETGGFEQFLDSVEQWIREGEAVDSTGT